MIDISNYRNFNEFTYNSYLIDLSLIKDYIISFKKYNIEANNVWHGIIGTIKNGFQLFGAKMFKK